MTALKTVTVRLPEKMHREVKVRAAERGDSLEGIARAAFAAYLGRDPDAPGSLLERAGVSPAGLGAGEVNVPRENNASESRVTGSPSSPAPSPSVFDRLPGPAKTFGPDPKVKK